MSPPRIAVTASGTAVTNVFGVGPVVAAYLIGHSGDIRRFPTAAHYARYNGTAPIQASSGPIKRHRLNPRGNRQLIYAEPPGIPGRFMPPRAPTAQNNVPGSVTYRSLAALGRNQSCLASAPPGA